MDVVGGGGADGTVGLLGSSLSLLRSLLDKKQQNKVIFCILVLAAPQHTKVALGHHAIQVTHHSVHVIP